MKRKSKPQKVDKMKFFLYRGFFNCGECGFTITADRKIKRAASNMSITIAPRKTQSPMRSNVSQKKKKFHCK